MEKKAIIETPTQEYDSGSQKMKKPDGYWNLENTVAETTRIVEEKGYLPPQKELVEMKRSSLAFAIIKNGGYSKMRGLLGLEEGYKPDGYWNLENTLAEAKKIVEEKGYLPSAKKLREMKRANLVFAIIKNGGYNKIREMLGLEEGYKPNG